MTTKKGTKKPALAIVPSDSVLTEKRRAIESLLAAAEREHEQHKAAAESAMNQAEAHRGNMYAAAGGVRAYRLALEKFGAAEPVNVEIDSAE